MRLIGFTMLALSAVTGTGQLPGGPTSQGRFAATEPAPTGNAARGQATFEGKGGCLRCHRVNARGSRTAPDLTDIGTRRSRDALERALRDPAAALLPVNRSVRAVTRDGRTVVGRRLNEDTHSVQLLDDKERLVSLEKDSLREYKVLSMPLMPSYATALTADEMADLVAYLMTLTGETS